MPVTRSFSHQPRPQPFPSSSPPQSQPHKAMTTRSSTNIVLTLASDGVAQKKKSSKRKNENSRSRPRPPPVPESEIIEISSDDDSPPSKPTAVHTTIEPAAIAELRRQISKYREEAAKSKKDLEKISKVAAELKEENQELQKLRNPGNGRVTLDTNNLGDQLECEICTSRMWTPYVLPDCGHTFCQSCLQDWFGATQAQFIASNPGYNPNHSISNQNVNGLYNLAQAVIHNPHTANSPQVAALVSQLLPSHPQYTCPTCRETVTSRPIEVFALKALIRTITSAMGESSPIRPKQLGKAPVANPWDGFFHKKA